MKLTSNERWAAVIGLLVFLGLLGLVAVLSPGCATTHTTNTPFKYGITDTINHDADIASDSGTVYMTMTMQTDSVSAVKTVPYETIVTEYFNNQKVQTIWSLSDNVIINNKGDVYEGYWSARWIGMFVSGTAVFFVTETNIVLGDDSWHN